MSLYLTNLDPIIKKNSLHFAFLLPLLKKGDIPLSHNIILRDVFHVSKLSSKILFIYKLTTNLKCLVTFNPTLCKFKMLIYKLIINLKCLATFNYFSLAHSDVRDPSNFPNIHEHVGSI